jgi:hypothetical protein
MAPALVVGAFWLSAWLLGNVAFCRKVRFGLFGFIGRVTRSDQFGQTTFSYQVPTPGQKAIVGMQMALRGS